MFQRVAQGIFVRKLNFAAPIKIGDKNPVLEGKEVAKGDRLSETEGVRTYPYKIPNRDISKF